MSDIPYDWIKDAWNETARRWKLAPIRFMPVSRQKKVRDRWGEWREFDPDGPQAFFEDVLESIAERPFWRGKNDRTWKVTFDYLVRNDTNALKLVEGKEAEKKPLRLTMVERDMLANIREMKGEEGYQWLLARFRKERET